MKTIKKIIHSVLLFSITVFIINPESLSAQEERREESGQAVDDDLFYFMGMGDYVNVDVEVASMFEEDDLVVGSSVSRITPEMWRKMGARRITDALETQTAMVNYHTLFGFYNTVIRGYSRDAIATKGVVTLVDGVPVIECVNGTNDGMPNFGLGSLKSIELIKGPGSAIYGSDAFHGVISLNTFESDKDTYEVEAAGAYPLYGDGSIRISQGLGKTFRINATAGYSGQFVSEELEYDYNTKEKQANFPPETAYQPAAKGTGIYENRYKTATGVFKINYKPLDKLKLNIGGYIVSNKADDFSGVKEASFIQLNEYDLSSQDSTIYIYRGSAVYSLGNNVSVEASGYYWKWNMLYMAYSFYDGCFAYFHVDEERTGANIIIKQPDNPLNLQWLVAYSRSNFKMTTNRVNSYDKNGEPYLPFTGTAEGSFIINSGEGMDRSINSVYGQTKWGMIKKKLFLLLGGRLDHYSDYGIQTTPRGGIIFLPTDKSSIKALYGRAFRAPSGNDIYGISHYVLGNEDLKPEVIDYYEVIYIYKGEQWRITLNGFYSSWQNGIIVEPFTDNATEKGLFAEFTNSGKNRAYGSEINLFFPVDPFAFEIGGSYVKSTALDLKTVTNPEKDDYDFDSFPEYIIISGMHYALKAAGINFYLKNRFYLKMKETAQTNENDFLPTYWRMDLNISKTVVERLNLYLDIRNLTNRKNYIPSLYTSMFSEEDGIPEAGISVLLRAGYRI
jgi:outer membrane receptor protein involved in Fe transport